MNDESDCDVIQNPKQKELPSFQYVAKSSIRFANIDTRRKNDSETRI